jgi:hypothetical protein
VNKICSNIECGKDYPPTGKNQKYCSIRCANRVRYLNNKADFIRRVLKYNKEHIEKHKQWGKKHRENIKDNFFNLYGNKCNCCGETNRDFLTLDHVMNDGAKRRGGYSYRDLKQEYKHATSEYNPSIYQVLCYNCNCGKQRNNGVCPHMKIGVVQ